MGRLLGRIGGRGAVAAGLVLLVVGAVALARFIGGDAAPRGLPDPGATSTVDPTAGDDGLTEVTPSPGATHGETPSARPGDAELRGAASEFTLAWLRRELDATAWYAGVARLATESLGQSLAGVDPRTVPATASTGTAVIVLRTDLYAVVAVPVDTGTLRLNLLLDGERWLVDGVDWERA